MPIVTKRPLREHKLRELREDAELSQNDLAERCTAAGRPVTQSQISRLEAGLHKPYMPLVRVLADVLGVTVDDLLDDESAGRAA